MGKSNQKTMREVSLEWMDYVNKRDKEKNNKFKITHPLESELIESRKLNKK